MELSVFGGWLLLAYLGLIFYPFVMYSIYKLQENYDTAQFTQRRQSFIFLLLISSVITVISNHVPLAVYFLLTDSPPSYTKLHPMDVAMPFFILSRCILYLICILINCRIWLLFYDYKYQSALNSKEWQVLLMDINGDENECSNNWFIANKRSFGNGRYIIKISFIYWIFVVSIFLAIMFLFSDEIHTKYHPEWSFTFSVSSICIIFCACIWCRYPSFNDEFCIKQEIKYIVYGFAIHTLIVGLFIVIFSALRLNYKLWWMATALVLDNNFLTMIYLLVCGVMRLNRKKSEINGDEVHLQLKLKNILCSVDGYHSFMNHLMKEFSVENLLFVTEYLQFRDVVISKYLPMIANVCGSNISDLLLNLSKNEIISGFNNLNIIPTSHIVHQFDNRLSNENKISDENVFRIFSGKLCSKYIATNIAPFEVNISFSTRKSLMFLFETAHVDSICTSLAKNFRSESENNLLFVERVLCMFDVATKEIMNLMNDSLLRFARTSAGVELMQIENQKNTVLSAAKNH